MVILLIALVVILLMSAKLWYNGLRVAGLFARHNVIVFGVKGAGKDLLFQLVINRRRRKYYSNISYGGRGELVNISDVSVPPNTYQTLIDGKYYRVAPRFADKCDIYISDGGVYLPSQYDTYLSKQYKSFPLAYALSRHLWDNRIHINTQALNRLWLKLREQSDCYIKCRYSFRFLFWLFTRITIYDNYQSALDDRRPIKKRWFNKFAKSQVDVYDATAGDIKSMYVCQRVRRIKYDTRAFKKMLIDDDNERGCGNGN